MRQHGHVQFLPTFSMLVMAILGAQVKSNDVSLTCTLQLFMHVKKLFVSTAVQVHAVTVACYI